MTNREVLCAYRTAVLDLQELELALARTGSVGQPRGIQGIRLDAMHGTNHPAAAALQAAEGIQEMIDRKRDEMAQLSGPVFTMLTSITDPKTFMVIQAYYLYAETDSNIAENLCMSRCRINQIRNQFLAQVS